MGRNIVVLGSAPYIDEFLPKVADAIRGCEIHAVNNSWKIASQYNLHAWYRSYDFYDVAQLKNVQLPEGCKDVWFNHKNMMRVLPHYYHKKGHTGSMLLNVLYYLYDELLKKEDLSNIYVTGSDFVYDKKAYKKKSTHFYGNSSLDPMRYGADWLKEELNHVAEIFSKTKCNIYKCTPLEKESLLPFPAQHVDR